MTADTGIPRNRPSGGDGMATHSEILRNCPSEGDGTAAGTEILRNRPSRGGGMTADAEILRNCPFRELVGTGLIATVAATAATTFAAVLARAGGVTFTIPEGGETIPASGIAVVTAFFSIIGVLIAAAFRRWSHRSARHFATTTTALTAISLLPPFLVGAAPTTVIALLILHLIPAAMMIPTLTRTLRPRKPVPTTNFEPGKP
ncbi:DUF6069 family protein [Actinoplanes couchii]|uniref:Uncharacterized protein n=1 Tax=Actinoplanes couchii TaxID=403638 RepID=A0ABQ3X6Z8_9ACTN|nr:DUF6069 family protein [Actinoplanes couchii]MDR6322121.1 hypothetical protein [Actinoplanes couchii]GID54286.1 hypothetical protein Aco03nite_026900 [Actinoplanes couchii]